MEFKKSIVELFKFNWNKLAIIFSLILGCIACYYSFENSTSYQVQKSRVDNVIELLTVDTLVNTKRDSLIKELQIQKAKEDIYLTQLTLQSDKFLAFVTLLFAVVALINITIISTAITDKINIRINDFENKKESAIAKNYENTVVHDLRIKELEKDFYRDNGNTFVLVANVHYSENKEPDRNESFFVYYMLLGIESSLKSISSNKDEGKTRGINLTARNNLTRVEKRLGEVLKNKPKEALKHLSELNEELQETVRTIKKLGNTDIKFISRRIGSQLGAITHEVNISN